MSVMMGKFWSQANKTGLHKPVGDDLVLIQIFNIQSMCSMKTWQVLCNKIHNYMNYNYL